MQFAGELGATKQNLGVFSWLVRLVQEEGMTSLYRGLSAAYGLQFSVTATRFGTYALAKKIIPPEQRNDGVNFVLAGASGGKKNVYLYCKTKTKELIIQIPQQPWDPLREIRSLQ